MVLVVLACVLRATTKRGRQLFGGKKCTPRKNAGYAYVSELLSYKFHPVYLSNSLTNV